MAQATLQSPAGIPRSVASKLRGLRMRINLWLLIDGVSKVLATAAVLLFVLFVFDYQLSYWIDVDFSLRLVPLAVGCLLLGWLIYRHLILPFVTRVSDDALVLAVEKHYGRDLGESLISAVQFSRMSNEIEVQGVSPQLIRATIDQGTEAAGRLPFGSVVDTRWLTANAAIFVLGAVLLGLYVYGASAFRDAKYAENVPENEIALGGRGYSVQLLGIGFDREVLLKDVPWPQDVYFTINYDHDEDRVIVVPRGDDFQLKVRVREDSKYNANEVGEAGEVAVNLRGSAGYYSETLEVVQEKRQQADDETAADAGGGESQEMDVDYFYLEMPNVQEEFKFQIEAKSKRIRGKSQWYTVKLVDRPDVEELKLTTKLPEYAGGALKELPKGAGPHHVLAGSSLKIEGTANKPLSKAIFNIGGKLREVPLTGQKEFTANVPAEELGESFKSGAISIELFDTEELRLPNQQKPGPLKSRRPTKFSLRIQPDRAPDVVAALKDISGMVTPQVRIPFDCLIKDEFAVTDVKLKYTWKDEDNIADTDEGQYDVEAAQKEIGERSMRFQDVFDLAPLEIPAGSNLKFHISALDNKLPEANEGQSTEFRLLVVTEAELNKEFLRRQAELHQDFKRLYENQEKYKTDTEVLEAETRDAQSLTTKQRQRLLELQKNHKLLGTNIGGVAKRMQSIVREMENNRLDDSDRALLSKINENVIQPMQELSKQDVPETIKQLDNTRAAAEKRPQRQQAIEKAIAQQEKNLQKMDDVLKVMAKTEGYQEVVRIYYEILQEQEKVRKLSDEEKQRLREKVLNGEVPPKQDGDSGSGG